ETPLPADLYTVASVEEVAIGRGRWRRSRGYRRNSKEGEKDQSPKEEKEKLTENHDLLLRQKKQRMVR
ncbi:hypothetical protein BHE74_00047541, partial [Ensete ventricosum]